MTVTSVSRWNGGSRDAVVAIAKKVKPLVEKAGGEYRASQIHTGTNAGQWLALIVYPNWEAYGRGTQALTQDPAFHAVVAEISAISQMVDRTLIVSVDL